MSIILPCLFCLASCIERGHIKEIYALFECILDSRKCSLLIWRLQQDAYIVSLPQKAYSTACIKPATHSLVNSCLSTAVRMSSRYDFSRCLDVNQGPLGAARYYLVRWCGIDMWACHQISGHQQQCVKVVPHKHGQMDCSPYRPPRPALRQTASSVFAPTSPFVLTATLSLLLCWTALCGC